MHKFINELVLTFRNKLVRSINTKTLVNITIRVLYTALFHHKAWFCYYYYYYYYTVSQKVVLSLLERKVSFQQKAYNTSVCCRITLRKLEVRICRNFQKKSMGRVTFDKNWNVSCHVAEYCHKRCSKCPPFARIHARRRPCHSSMHWQWWSGQCHAEQVENAALNTCFCYLHKYLTRTGNGNNK